MKRIRDRMFVQILLPVLAVYALVIGGGTRYLSNEFRDRSLTRKHAALENIARGIDDWLLSRVSEVVQLSRIPLFVSGEENDIQSYMKYWQGTLSFRYDALYLIEDNGRYWSTDGRTGFLESTLFPDLFFEDKLLFLYEGPLRFGSALADHFVIGVPLYNEEGDTTRVLTATIDLESLSRVFGYFTFDEFDSWMVVNPRSIIITHEDSALVGLSERGEYGRTFLDNTRWEDKEVFVQVMRNGWKLVTFLESEKLLASYRQVTKLLILFSIFLVILVTGFVLLLSATLARPVRRLTDGVHRIMAGDYGQEVHMSTGDELSDLADSFNRLARRMAEIRTEDRFSFLGHVAARMAHELRKPLHVIQLAAKAMEEGEDTKTKYLGIIDQEIANADRFVEEILSFAHVDSMDKSLYSLRTLLETVVEKFRLICEEEGIVLKPEISPNLPEIYMDVMRMEEVFSNVLQNAVDAVKEASNSMNERSILLATTFENGEISVLIQDSGDGFNAIYMDRFFDPYFTTREKGTGLGLSVCYRILMAHGAKIVLDNSQDHRGRVRITFLV